MAPILVLLLAFAAASTREQREQYGATLEERDYATRFLNVNPQVEVSEVTQQLRAEFVAKGLTWGSPVFLREYKFRDFAAVGLAAERKKAIAAGFESCYYMSGGLRYRNSTCPFATEKQYLALEAADPIHGVIEAWVRNGQTYTLFRTYKVCAFTGSIGAKKKEGDSMTPEGIFTASVQTTSSYYLALRVNYPSQFDIKTNPTTGRRGGDVMIHGKCVSIGCSAMSGQIPEIYSLVRAAGGTAPFHAFPFPLKTDDINAAVATPEFAVWKDFWRTLKPVHDAFEETRIPPVTSVVSVSAADKARGVESYNGFRFAFSRLAAGPVTPRVQ